MTRILEFIVAAIIVFVLAVVFGLLLPSHGHVERSLDVSHNIRHVNDMLMNFRRFPEWGSLALLDPRTQFTPEGPDFGVGAKLNFRSAEPSIGVGSYEIASNEPDSKIVWNITNDWKGTNKAYTIKLEPGKNGRIVKVTWSYDVDFGNDLIARYSGLYLHGAPDRQIQANLASLQSQLAVIPNVDYTQTDIFIADVAAQPALVVQTTSPRSLDEVDFATSKAMEEMHAYMKKNGLNAAGPRSIVTVEWGDENYTFDVVQPIDKGVLTIDKKEYTIGPAVPPPAPTTPEPEPEPLAEGQTPPPPVELKPGELDKKGNLVVAGTVRARTT
ncbi:MAG TPA: polyketide cyclase, partial [Tahibacter sp.]|nr:polyketide cyclase [Tahibacter sp.]